MPAALRSLDPGRGPVHDTRVRGPPIARGARLSGEPPQLLTRPAVSPETPLLRLRQPTPSHSGTSSSAAVVHLADISAGHGHPGPALKPSSAGHHAPRPQGGVGEGEGSVRGGALLPSAAYDSALPVNAYHTPHAGGQRLSFPHSRSVGHSGGGGDASHTNTPAIHNTRLVQGPPHHSAEIGLVGMSLENTIHRRQMQRHGNNSDAVKSLLGGSHLLDRSRAAQLLRSRNEGEAPGGSAGPSTALQNIFNGSFNSSRGPGGALAGRSTAAEDKPQHRTTTTTNSPSHGGPSLFSGSFGPRAGGRGGLIVATRAAAAANDVHRRHSGALATPPRGGVDGRSTNTTSSSLPNNSPSGHAVAAGGPGGSRGGGHAPTSNSNNNNTNTNPTSSSSTPYDFRVVLSSGKTSTKPIELTVGSGSTQGLRPTMEDEHFCKLYSAVVREQPVSFLGILDGHCGRRVAEIGSKCLPSFFLSHQSLGDNNALTLVESIMQADRAIYQTLSLSKGGTTPHTSLLAGSSGTNNIGINNHFTDTVPSGGSTLICAAVHGRMLYVGCLGDARAVLLDGKTTIAMSEDHKPGNTKESRRIQRCGGFVQFGRVCGVLAVSRALGDFEFKSPPPLGSARGTGSRGGNWNRSFGTGTSPSRLHLTVDGNPSASSGPQELMVSNVADVRQLSLTDDSKFLILACDGLWDVMSNEEATQFVKDFLSYTPEVNDILVLTGKRAKPSPAVIERVLNNCSQKLTEFAVDRGSTDNVSVVLLFFHDVVETVVGFTAAEMPSSGNNSLASSHSQVPTPSGRNSRSPMNARAQAAATRLTDPSSNSGYVLPVHHRTSAGKPPHGRGSIPKGPQRNGVGWLPTANNFNGSFQRGNPNANSSSMNRNTSNTSTSGTGFNPNGSLNSRSRPLW